MKFKVVYNLILMLTAIQILFGSSCKTPSTPEPTPVNPWDTVSNYKGVVIPQNQGSLILKLSYNFKSDPIEFGSKYYINAANDTFTINELKHYLSNITLTKPDGGLVRLGTYHLADAKVPGSQTLTINNVPQGNYTGISFLLGVDSTANHSGIQEGALDPGWGMFWIWSTGYIFYRINGNVSNGTNYSYDLGGDNNLTHINLDLNAFKVKSNQPKFELAMDVNEMFQNPAVFSMVNDTYNIHDPADSSAKKLSINMEDMITLKSLLP